MKCGASVDGREATGVASTSCRMKSPISCLPGDNITLRKPARNLQSLSARGHAQQQGSQRGSRAAGSSTVRPSSAATCHGCRFCRELKSCGAQMVGVRLIALNAVRLPSLTLSRLAGESCISALVKAEGVCPGTACLGRNSEWQRNNESLCTLAGKNSPFLPRLTATSSTAWTRQVSSKQAFLANACMLSKSPLWMPISNGRLEPLDPSAGQKAHGGVPFPTVTCNSKRSSASNLVSLMTTGRSCDRESGSGSGSSIGGRIAGRVLSFMPSWGRTDAAACGITVPSTHFCKSRVQCLRASASIAREKASVRRTCTGERSGRSCARGHSKAERPTRALLEVNRTS